MAYQEHLQRVDARKRALKERLEAAFPEPVSIVLEIGCGHGHWLTDFAAARPEAQCAGIDLIGDRIERANRKASRAGLENLRFLKAEAGEFLEGLPKAVRLESVFVLFPDPWPKKRHWKNRLMNPRFLAELADRCGEGTRLYFRTDHDGYFEWTEEVVAASDHWRREAEADWPFERETVFQSKADAYQSLVLAKR